MTLSTTTNRATYSGDGATIAFAAPFLFLQNSHIEAVLRDAAGVETKWVENTEYTLTATGNPAGGTLTVETSPTDYTPASGETLVIRRVVPETQETDYPEGGAFPASAHENALDKLTMLVQQHSEELTRTLASPVSDSTLGELPLKSDLANNVLAFDANGDPIPGQLVAGTTSVSAFIATLLDDTNAAAARATLGLVIGTDIQADLDAPSQAEAEAGTATTERAWTAERIKQAIAALESASPAIALPKEYIAGLTLSKSAADALAIAAGEARDAGDAADMTLAAFTKDVSSSWAVGTGNGSLDTGSYSATTLYAVWLVRRSDTEVVDVLSSESFSAPTMPTNYDQKRLIGYFVTDSSPNIIAFEQVGDYFELTGALVTDVADSTMTTDAYETGTLSVPPSCLAVIYGFFENASGNNTNDGTIHIRRKSSAELATVNNEAWSGYFEATGGGKLSGGRGFILVDGSSQIEYAINDAQGSGNASIKTLGCHMLTRSAP